MFVLFLSLDTRSQQPLFKEPVLETFQSKNISNWPMPAAWRSSCIFNKCIMGHETSPLNTWSRYPEKLGLCGGSRCFLGLVSLGNLMEILNFFSSPGGEMPFTYIMYIHLSVDFSFKGFMGSLLPRGLRSWTCFKLPPAPQVLSAIGTQKH